MGVVRGLLTFRRPYAPGVTQLRASNPSDLAYASHFSRNPVPSISPVPCSACRDIFARWTRLSLPEASQLLAVSRACAARQ